MIMYDIGQDHLEELQKSSGYPGEQIMVCEHEGEVWIGNVYCLIKLKSEVYKQLLELYPLEEDNIKKFKYKHIEKFMKYQPKIKKENKINYSDVIISDRKLLFNPARVYKHNDCLDFVSIELDYITNKKRRYIEFHTKEEKGHVFGYRKDTKELIIIFMSLDFETIQIRKMLGMQIEEINLLLEGSK